MEFSADDRGNVVDFYEKMEDGTWEQGARLDCEAGDDANSLCWVNWSGDKLEEWAKANGYNDAILEGKEYNQSLDSDGKKPQEKVSY